MSLSGRLCQVQSNVCKMQVKQQSQTDFGDSFCTSKVYDHFLFDEDSLR